jgi:Ca2+-binding RTX toxin-like protein
VSDGDGGITTDTAQVNVLTSGTLLIDGILYVVGTNCSDIALISQCNGTIYVCATFNDNNPETFNAADVTEIQVRLRGGNDILFTTSNVTELMTIDGGSGNDLLVGGGGRSLILGGSGNDSLYGNAGDDVLLGGSGNDDLMGGTGNDVLVGGTGNDNLCGGLGRDLIIGSDGNDSLQGGGDDDILIGGYTIHDNDVSALDAVMAVWTSSDSFTARVATLTSSGGLLQAGVAVFDDGDHDELSGQSGRDLYFGDITGKDKDMISLQSTLDALVVVD